MAKAEDQGVVKYNTASGEVRLSNGIIRKYLVSGSGNVSDQEVMMFLTLCKYQQLNPFLREAYLIKYSDNQAAACVVGKEVFTQRAAIDEDFDGFSAGVYIRKSDGEIEKRTGSMVLEGEDLVGGWAEVNRKDWSVPVEAAVSFEEYAGRKRDGDLNRQWSRMPATMIRKVALVQALREAFAKTFAGMLDSSEIDTGDEPLPTSEVKVEARINEGNAAHPPTSEAAGDFEPVDENDPDYIPQPDYAEADEKDEVAGQAKVCLDAVKLLLDKKAITEKDAADYKAAIGDMQVAGDVKGLKARHNKLRDLYMEVVAKAAQNVGEE